MKKIIVGVTGASGAQLAYHVLKALQAQEVEIHLILSEGAKVALPYETAYTEQDFRALADAVYSEKEIAACVASGSYRTDGMIVVPCSMKTLSGIANAYDENLIIRAADVCLKERRKLVLVPREMPLNNAHLRNMLTASQDGAVILPPMLSFYMGDDSVQRQLDQITGKILMQFGLEHASFTAWQGGKT